MRLTTRLSCQILMWQMRRPSACYLSRIGNPELLSQRRTWYDGELLFTADKGEAMHTVIFSLADERDGPDPINGIRHRPPLLYFPL